MNIYPSVDYGPLTKLIGKWTGEKGIDIAPEEAGPETNEYYETMVFEGARDLDNAGEQDLVALQYHQKVFRKRDNKMILNQTGYWILDVNDQKVMNSFVIPRGLAIVAHGDYKTKDNQVTITVKASKKDDIAQSPFLKSKAKTKSFNQKLTFSDTILSYSQTTIIDIYGKEFEHTESNFLIKVIEKS